MNKRLLLDKVIARLEREFETLAKAAREAHAGATNSEVKQEGKYDTRAIEASYLASGQSKRAAEIQSQIQKLQHLSIEDFKWVHVQKDSGESYYFVVPFAGGFTLDQEGTQIQVISTLSPLGTELLSRSAGDDFEFKNQRIFIENVK